MIEIEQQYKCSCNFALLAPFSLIRSPSLVSVLEMMLPTNLVQSDTMNGWISLNIAQNIYDGAGGDIIKP